jgi:deoxynucleoside triphosphate triphosphohydrolase SAMHD1
MAWTGVDEAKWTSEQRVERGIEQTPLSPRDKSALRSMRLSFVTALGTETARTTLGAELPKLGLNNFDGLVFSEEMQSGDALPPDLEQHLRAVGTSTLAWARHGERDLAQLNGDQLRDCERDALGYRGAKALASTPLNVPAGTLTALWCPGFYGGEPWMPLLIRRGYIDKLIIA